MKSKILSAGFLILFMGVFAAFAQKSDESMTIKSTLACQTCVNKIESELPYLVKGIKTVKADFHTNEIQVTYRTDKTTPDEIRKAITLLGYDADNIPADPAAFKKLSDHCQQEITEEKAAAQTQKPGCGTEKKPSCCGKH